MADNVLFITNAFDTLSPKKDTSVFMMREFLERQYEVFQCLASDLTYSNGKMLAHCNQVSTDDNNLVLQNQCEISLQDFQFCFMRTDPPVDEDYLTCLHLLGVAHHEGLRVINHPEALKTFNEKIFAFEFPEFTPPTLLTTQKAEMQQFQQTHNELIVKPVNGMGGDNIHKISTPLDQHTDMLQTLSNNFTRPIILQKFLPQITLGDFRILVIHGKPFPIALARIPRPDSFLGNLAQGGKGVATPISDIQKNIASKVGERLMQHEILFAGIDIIDDHLTEINITSPTCAVEIFDQSGQNPIAALIESL